MLILHEVFETALVDFKAGRYARAAGGLSQIVAISPQHADSWYYLGEVREAEGERTQAVLCYQKAVAAPSGHAAARQALARISGTGRRQAIALEAEGRVEEAAACWSALSLIGLESEDATDQVRRLARTRLEEAEAGEPTSEHSGNFKIWITREATHRLQTVLSAGDLPAAAAECDRVLALAPNIPVLLAQLRTRSVGYIERAVVTWLAKGDPFQAAELLTETTSLHGSEPKLVACRRQVVDRLVEEGGIGEKRGDVAGAARAYRRAISLDPQATTPRRHLSALEERSESRSRELLAEAALDAQRGDLEAAAARCYEAAACSLDSAPIYEALLEMRFRPISGEGGRLLMSGIGPVDFKNVGECTQLVPAQGAPHGTVLVAFKREPALIDDRWEHFQVTSINWESREICRLFLRMGYAVDVVNFDGKPPADRAEDYAAVFAASSFLARHHETLPASARRIVLMTTSSPDFQNATELDRIAQLSRRRPGNYAPKRQVADAADQLRSLELADHGLLIGNAVTLATYPEHLRSRLAPIRVSASRVNWIKSPKDFVPESREFLWYFGHGAVLKGLDLLLDVFSRQDRWTLNVVGHVAYEPDFEQMYFEELYRNPRIRMLGHLRGDSPVLAEACRRCFCFIAPSASEGMSNAVATCLQVGLYPVLSRSSGIDLPEGCGTYLETISEASIREAVERVGSMADAELVRQIEATQKHALAAYSREAYTRSMGERLEAIMTSPPVRAGAR